MKPTWATSAVVGILCGIVADSALDRCPVLADALEDAGYGAGPIAGSNLRFLRGSPHECRLALASLLDDLAAEMRPAPLAPPRPPVYEYTPPEHEQAAVADIAEMVEEATRRQLGFWARFEEEMNGRRLVPEADALRALRMFGGATADAGRWLARRFNLRRGPS